MPYGGYKGLFVDNPAGGIGPIGPPGPATTLTNNVFTPTLNQTVFNLTASPLNANATVVTVNGIRYRNAVDFTIVLNVLTWLNTPFNLGPPDILQVLFQA